jgi:hypothetical protein
LKTGATSDGDDQAFLEEDDEYVIPAPEEPQHETTGQNETYEERKLSPENPVYTELDVNGRNTTSKWKETYQTTRSWIKANAKQKSNLRPVQGSQKSVQPVVLSYSLYNLSFPFWLCGAWFRLLI